MTGMIGRCCLAGAVVAPLVGAVVVGAGPGSQQRRCQRAARLGWVSALLAVAVMVSVALGGSFGLTVLGTSGRPALGLWADPLTVTLLVLVCGVGATVQSFSVRYLQADPTGPRFFTGLAVVVTAMAVVCTSASVVVLVAAWVVAGIGFVAVVGCRIDLPGVRASARRTLAMFVLGDLALVVAVGLVLVRAGNVDIVSNRALRAAAGSLGGLGSVVALLVVVAALTRSAQGPLGRWLPGTVAAPTPASALLHAGVVNGGGILLVRLGALAGDSTLAMAAAFAVAGLTAAAASAVMTRKADVKGSLVFSTMGQMGFMVAECTVGAYLAAVVHLVGHGMYKATLFFGSGSQVPRIGMAPAAPATSMAYLGRIAATGAIVATTLAAMIAIPGVLAHRGSDVLLVFTAATAGTAGWSWWGARPRSARLTAWWAVAMLGAGALYGLALGGLGSFVGPALPTAGTATLNPWWLLSVAAVVLAGAALGQVPGLRRWLIAALLDAGAPPVARPTRWDRTGHHGTPESSATPALLSAGSLEERAA